MLHNSSTPVLKAEKCQLEVDVSQLEDELSTLAVASRSLTACTVIPIIGQYTRHYDRHFLTFFLVLLVAIVTAFLPVVSNILGTRDF